MTHDMIVACARGMRQARETGLGLELVRFSDAALAAYAEKEMWTVRAWCPAGVTLQLVTDSPTLDIELALGPGARQPAYVDAYVDGRFAATLGSATPGETLAGTFTLPGTPAHVSLYLPHCRQAGIRTLALADGASWTPAPAQPILLALGDSITQGMDAHHPSLTYPAVAARRLGMSLYNGGIGGYVFDAASLPDAPVADPALITVAYGTNDWSHRRDVAHARDYLTRLRALYPTTPVAVLAPLWRSADATEEAASLADYRAALTAIVAGFPGMTTVPMPALLPPGPAFLCDGVHPDAAGHVVYGENLAGALQAVFSLA
jgi:lysophospholipase L1-like esterase